MAYNNLDPNDTMIVNRGSNSYSVTVDQVSNSSPVLEDNDVFLVNRGDQSFSVTKKIIADEIGKEGKIEAPVVVLTPPNGAGLGDIQVNPAAEGIADVDQVTTTTSISLWNQDQVWSANQSGTTLGGYEWVQTFNGTVDAGLTEPQGPGSTSVTFTPEVSGSVIRIRGRSSGTAPFKLKVTDQNGDEQDVSNLWTNNAAFEWITLPSTITALKGIEIYSVDNGSNFCQTTAVEVDGRQLVNAGITPPPDLGSITESSTTATITYTTDSYLDKMAVGQAMTQQPAYTPVTSSIDSVSTANTTFTTYLGWGGHPSSGAGYVGAAWPSDTTWANLPDNGQAGGGASAGKGKNTVARVITGVDNSCSIGDWSTGNGGTEPWVIDMGEVVTVSIIQSGVTSLKTTNTADQTYAEGTDGTAVSGGFRGTGRYFWWVNPGQPAISSLNLNSVAGGVILTFDSNKDLANFRPGDLVQGSTVTNDLQSQDFGNNKIQGTVVGATWQTSVQKSYGGAADWLGNSVLKHIEMPVTDAFLVGTGDFTFSWWAYHPTIDNGSNSYLFDQGSQSGSGDTPAKSRFAVYRSGSGGQMSVIVSDSVFGGVIPADTYNANEWVHFAIVRHNGTLKGYVNGRNQQAGNVDASGANLQNATGSSRYPQVGNTTGPVSTFNYGGYLQDVLIYKKALYTENFTPPDYPIVSEQTGDLNSQVDTDQLALAIPLNNYIYDPVYCVSTADIANNNLTVDGGTWSAGNVITGGTYQGKGDYVSYDSNTLELTEVTNRWMIDEQSVGLKAESDDTYTKSAPGTDDLEFQSANGNPATTAFSGDGCTLRTVTWMLQESTGDKDGPWGATTEYAETVAIAVGDEVPAWSGPDDLKDDTFYRVKVKYTADSQAPEVTSTDWNVFKTSNGDTPASVQISGLRFDPQRLTTLERPADLGSTTKFTISLWAKVTENTGNKYAFSIPCNTRPIDGSAIQYSDNQGISARPLSGIWRWYGAGAGDFDIGTCTLNTWQHVVVSCDGTTVSGYVNGVKAAGTAPPGSYWSESIRVGNRLNENSGSDIIFPGYLSDVFFVEGQSLDAYAFGKNYDGLWGPLPSDTVKNNISRNESPYDQRPNMDVQWSSASYWNDTNGFGGSVAAIFDGDPSTNRSPNNSQTLIFSPTQFASANSVTLTFSGDTETTPPPRINGNDVPYAGPGVKLVETVDVSGTGFNELSFQRVDGGPGAINVISIAVDGMELVDGPADNSQNWSDSVDTAGDTGMPGEPYTNMFAGENLLAQASDSGGLELTTWTFNPPIGNGIDDVVEVKWYVSGSGLSYAPQVNGADFAASNNAWTTVPGGQVTSVGLCHNQGSAANGVYGFKVNGKELIDGGAQWDTSQIWSDLIQGDVLTTSGSPGTALFDGNIGPGFANGVTAAASETLSIDFGTTFDSASTVTIYGYVGGTENAGVLEVNGSSVSIPPYGGDNDRSVTVSLAGGLQTIEWTYVSGSSFIYMQAIEVDGKILVDAGSFGDNGFYLPFDPNATGVNYSQYGGSGAGQTGGTSLNWAAAFDGNTREGTISQSTTTTWTYPGSGVAGSTIAIYGYKDATPGTLVINGVDVTSQVPNHNGIGTNQLTTLTGITLPLQTITITGSPANTVALSGVVIDGNLLVDHNNIGVDASGNDNHLHDENFAVGNTSQRWSSGTSVGGYQDNRTIDKAFDGNPSTFAQRDNAVGITVYTFATPVPVTNTVTFKAMAEASDNQVYLTGPNGNSTAISNTGTNGVDVSSDVASEIGNAINGVTLINGGAVSRLYEIIVDGKLLVDANIQDTVVDTPVRNYAVLDESDANGVSELVLSNGSLNAERSSGWASTAATIKDLTSGKYYWEVILTGSSGARTGLSSVSRTSQADAGLLGTGDIAINASDGKVYVSGSPSADGGGDLKNKIIGIALDLDSSVVKFYADGTEVGSATGLTGSWTPVHTNNHAGVDIINYGQQPFAASNVTHDLRAGTVDIGGVTYNTFYTELAGYQVAGGYFYDEKNQRAVRGSDLIKRFGIDYADPRLGIYELCEVPNYTVIGYEKVYDQYKALRDYKPEVRIAEAETEAAEAETAEVQALADKYLNYLRAAACMWMVDKVYEAGQIVEFNGQLYRATINATATATTDPGDETDRWEALGISLS